MGSSNRDNPFRYLTVEDGQVFLDQSDRAIENMKELGIQGLIVVVEMEVCILPRNF